MNVLIGWSRPRRSAVGATWEVTVRELLAGQKLARLQMCAVMAGGWDMCGAA